MDGTPELDTRDCLVLKGLAILAISFHNYFHLISRVKENEFIFRPRSFWAYLNALREPHRILQASFSFLGHYGVQIFVFLSAYGLAIRYWDQPPGWITFIWGRACKLYPMFLLAILLWTLYIGLPDGPMGPVELMRRQGGALVLTVLGIENLAPGYGLPPVGPWWYVPFVMQLYCLWPLLRRFAIRFGRGGLLTLAMASLVLTYAVNGMFLARWSINLLETPLAHLPECCLGIAMARYGYRPGWATALVSSAVFLLSNVFTHFWLLSFISALVLMIWIFHRVRPVLRRSSFLCMVGSYSMALFFVNGFTRFPFVALALERGVWYFTASLGVASIGFALAVARLLTAVISRQQVGRFPELAAAQSESASA